MKSDFHILEIHASFAWGKNSSSVQKNTAHFKEEHSENMYGYIITWIKKEIIPS